MLYFNKLRQGDNCIVYGRSDILGRPLYDMLSRIGCTPINFHTQSNQKVFEPIMKDIDSIFLCLDKSDFVDKKFYNKLNPNCNIIDFGINFDKGYLDGNISKDVFNMYLKNKSEAIITATPSGTALSTLAQIALNIYMINKSLYK